MFDINRVFPFLVKSRRVKILSEHRTKYYPKVGDKPLSKKKLHQLEKMCKKLESNIPKIENCMEIHAKRILETRSLYVLTKELVNFIVEGEMKRRTLIDIKRIKSILKRQKKLFK